MNVNNCKWTIVKMWMWKCENVNIEKWMWKSKSGKRLKVNVNFKS